METTSAPLGSHFLAYLARSGFEPGHRLPSLAELSEMLGISINKLREQLNVARALGFVEVRPKTGIRMLPYSFTPSLIISLRYAMELDPAAFELFGSLRKHVEAGFWYEAVALLTEEDQEHLVNLVDQAWGRLRGEPIEIPHQEHRDLHLSIFRRLDNPFVRGVLEAYWDAYETVGLNLFTDYHYLQNVWNHHERMVRAIVDGDLEAGFKALTEHFEILTYRITAPGQPQPRKASAFA